jgi:flagellar assembly factor FliW
MNSPSIDMIGKLNAYLTPVLIDIGEIMATTNSTLNSQAVNNDNIITFPQAMIGLEEHTQFQVFHEQIDSPSVYYLRSISDPELMMSIASPDAFGFDYEINLTDEEESLLELGSADQAIVVLAVYKPNDDQQNDEDQHMKVMVKSPIIINTESKLAMQKHLPDLALLN